MLPSPAADNSLITALAQGAQWQKASQVFEQMHGQGCNPDVVTYTALISAFEKGGQWRLALEVRRCLATHAAGCPKPPCPPYPLPPCWRLLMPDPRTHTPCRPPPHRHTTA